MMRYRKLIDLCLLAVMALHLFFVFVLGTRPSPALQIALPLVYIAGTGWFVFSWRRRSDEVQVADAKNSLATGTAIGLATAFLAVVAVTNFPALAAPVTDAGWFTGNTLSPAIIGFTLGVMACIVLVSLFYWGAVVYWWLDRRRSH